MKWSIAFGVWAAHASTVEPEMDDSWMDFLMEAAEDIERMSGVSGTHIPRVDWFDYDYTLDDRRRMSPLVRQLAEDQLISDRINGPRFAPLLYEAPELYPSGDTEVSISIGNHVFGRAEQTVVLSIDGMPDRVVKYQADCHKPSSIHPLLRDAWFQTRVAALGITPEIHYISPPSVLRETSSQKTSFQMNLESRRKCIRRGGLVRFMIMQRVDIDMYALGKRNPTGNFKNAFEVLRAGMAMLQRLHQAGVIHGDIHPGNIASLRVGSVNRLVLMDFGFATFAEEAAFQQDRVRGALSYVRCLFTPWELLGMRGSFRDDVYRLLIVVAYLLNGYRFMPYCTGLESVGDDMLRFKRDSNIFIPPTFPSPFRSLTVNARIKGAIATRFVKILNSVRAIDGIDDLPDYVVLTNHINAIKDFLSL